MSLQVSKPLLVPLCHCGETKRLRIDGDEALPLPEIGSLASFALYSAAAHANLRRVVETLREQCSSSGMTEALLLRMSAACQWLCDLAPAPVSSAGGPVTAWLPGYCGGSGQSLRAHIGPDQPPPQPVSLAGDGDHDFIQMPNIIRRRPLGTTPTRSICGGKRW